MYAFLTVLILIASVLLIGAVLVQKSKGGGLSSQFGGGNQIMGVRKTTLFIEKATWSLALIICLLSILSSFLIPNDLVQGAKVKQVAAQETQATPFDNGAATTPATPATPAAPAEPAK